MDPRMVWRIIRGAVGLITAVWLIVRWVRAHAAKMRDQRDEDAYSRMVRQSFAEQVRDELTGGGPEASDPHDAP
jgi:hypothetical protein